MRCSLLQSGLSQQAENWRERILALAEKSQIKTRVELLLNQRNEVKPTTDFKTVELDIKPIEKGMVQVKDNVYASSSEVSNRQYWEFLHYLYTNGYEELYEEARVDLSKYDELTADLFRNYHYSPVNQEALNSRTWTKHFEKNLSFPAMDMSYKGAMAYCEWLTFQYNQQEDRDYKKVQFRLPTQTEWTMTALGIKGLSTWNIEDVSVTSYSDFGRKKIM